MTAEPMCQCPECGRLHRHLQAGRPPQAIAGPSLLRPPVNLPSSEVESARIFGDDLEHWRIRVGALHRLLDAFRHANQTLSESYHAMRAALIEIASVGDGFGARNRQSGTTGEGHARCRAIADGALGIGFEDLPSVNTDADSFWQDFKRESADASDSAHG